MTQVFTENGELVPVTVVEVGSNVVLQVKTVENDGYEAVQLGFDDQREVNANKPARNNTSLFRYQKLHRSIEHRRFVYRLD